MSFTNENFNKIFNDLNNEDLTHFDIYGNKDEIVIQMIKNKEIFYHEIELNKLNKNSEEDKSFVLFLISKKYNDSLLGSLKNGTCFFEDKDFLLKVLKVARVPDYFIEDKYFEDKDVLIARIKNIFSYLNGSIQKEDNAIVKHISDHYDIWDFLIGINEDLLFSQDVLLTINIDLMENYLKNVIYTQSKEVILKIIEQHKECKNRYERECKLKKEMEDINKKETNKWKNKI